MFPGISDGELDRIVAYEIDSLGSIFFFKSSIDFDRCFSFFVVTFLRWKLVQVAFSEIVKRLWKKYHSMFRRVSSCNLNNCI